MLPLTGIYAALLTGLFLLLSLRVIGHRRANRINLGDGGDAEMTRRIRAHGNFAEYAPLGLILLGIAELQDEATLWLHLLGGTLLVGRLAHGLNFTYGWRSPGLRVGGMLMTFAALGLGAVLALPL